MSNETNVSAGEPSSSRRLHRWAVLIVCLVWPLIWVGGLVTTYDAGMAVPDWPGTYGKNLFLYPYQTWLFGPFDLFIEHGHRLLGAIVGFVAIIAVIVAWMTEQRSWVRWLSVGLLVAVIGQGVLGGMRVVLSDRTLAMVHGCTGPLFFVICVALAVVTGRWWRNQTESESVSGPVPGRGAIWLAAAVTMLAYVQLLLGAQLRHVQVTASPSGFTHLVSTHITGAFVLWLLVGILAWRMSRLPAVGQSPVSDQKGEAAKAGCGDLTLSRPARVLVGLVGVQIALGLGTWVATYGWPYFAQFGPASAGYLVKSKAFTESLITTAHVATGSLILAVGAMMWLRLLRARFCRSEPSRVERGELVIQHRTVEKRQRLQVS